MNSQVVVNIDTELKQKAMKMAKKEGLTMKALLSFLLKWYVEDEIVLWAKIKRWYFSNLEIEWWSQKEIDNLNNNKNLKSLWSKLNTLLLDKKILNEFGIK